MNGLESGFKIKNGEFNHRQNSERFTKYNAAVEKITNKTNELKRKYAVSETAMSSFSPDLLPSAKLPAVLSEQVYADYQRILI